MAGGALLNRGKHCSVAGALWDRRLFLFFCVKGYGKCIIGSRRVIISNSTSSTFWWSTEELQIFSGVELNDMFEQKNEVELNFVEHSSPKHPLTNQSSLDFLNFTPRTSPCF